MALLSLELEPSTLSVWGPLLYKMRHRFVWTYGVPPDPSAFLRMPTCVGLMAITGIETLMLLGLLGKANFKAPKSLTTLE